MEPVGLRNIWSAETLLAGINGIGHQPGLLLTKVEGDQDLANEMAASWNKLCSLVSNGIK